MEVKIDTKNRIRLPTSSLKHLKLMPGDRVRFAITKDGYVVVLPKRVSATLRAKLKTVIE